MSATLLFCVQPMIAKMVLPLLGGTPAVWNTCMVFFQAALLVGYLYSHLLTTYLSRRRQVLVHILILLLPVLMLPISISDEAISTLVATDSPIPWLLKVLLISTGLPFFVAATSA